MTSNTLVCPFLTDDPLYAYGVEFGMLFARMRGDEDDIADYFTTWNQDQILLLASREGWRVTVGPQDEFWFWCRLERGAATARHRGRSGVTSWWARCASAALGSR